MVHRSTGGPEHVYTNVAVAGVHYLSRMQSISIVEHRMWSLSPNSSTRALLRAAYPLSLSPPLLLQHRLTWTTKRLFLCTNQAVHQFIVIVYSPTNHQNNTANGISSPSSTATNPTNPINPSSTPRNCIAWRRSVIHGNHRAELESMTFIILNIGIAA